MGERDEQIDSLKNGLNSSTAQVQERYPHLVPGSGKTLSFFTFEGVDHKGGGAYVSSFFIKEDLWLLVCCRDARVEPWPTTTTIEVEMCCKRSVKVLAPIRSDDSLISGNVLGRPLRFGGSVQGLVFELYLWTFLSTANKGKDLPEVMPMFPFKLDPSHPTTLYKS